MDFENPEQIVSSVKTGLLPQIREGIRCAVLYGSRAKPSETPKLNSDVDFFFVTNEVANPIIVVERVVDFFDRNGLTCDPFWYVDTYFFDAIEAGIDLTLWHEVFDLGQIVYAEPLLLQRVGAALHNMSPAQSCRKTISARRDREIDHIRSLIRNTDRILTEAILLAYCETMGSATWDELPEYNTLSRVAFSAGVIDQDIMLISDTLASLKAQVEMGAHQSAIESLAKIQKRLVRFVDERTVDR